MSDQPYLIVTYTFKNREFLVKMNIINGNSLHLCVTDKYTAEDWQCTYDASYIENLTHKTGNYKQFDIFITMLKSGLLKTSECVTLDLLTYEDLEQLRSRQIMGRTFTTPRSFQSNHINPNANRRFLILTYTVEFDRIHYPLPMEYCGPPDPQVLQTAIRKLESEVTCLQEQLSQAQIFQKSEAAFQISQLQKRVEDLEEENHSLKLEIQFLNNLMAKRTASSGEVNILQNTVRTLEENVLQDRIYYKKVIGQLQDERMRLIHQVEELSRNGQDLQRKTLQKPRKEQSESLLSTHLRRNENGQHLLISRHPGEGIGSPGIKEEHTINKIHSLLSEHNANKIQNKPQKIKQQSLNNRSQKCHQSQSVDNFCSTGRSHTVQRSNSESSVGSRAKSKASTKRSTCTVNFEGNKGQAHQVLPRGRPRERIVSQPPARNSSGSSAGSNSVRKKEVAKSSGSRYSSPCTSNSSCHCNVKIDKKIQNTLPTDRLTTKPPRQRHRKNLKLHLGMTDLERRIQALQKVLKEGLSMT